MADSEELKKNGAMAGSTSSIQLNEISGDTLTGRIVTDIYASSLMHNITMLRRALKFTGRKRGMGDLPE